MNMSVVIYEQWHVILVSKLKFYYYRANSSMETKETCPGVSSMSFKIVWDLSVLVSNHTKTMTDITDMQVLVSIDAFDSCFLVIAFGKGAGSEGCAQLEVIEGKNMIKEVAGEKLNDLVQVIKTVK